MSTVEERARYELQFQYRVYLAARDPHNEWVQERLAMVDTLVWVISGQYRVAA